MNTKEQQEKEIQQWLISWIMHKTNITKEIDINADYSALGLYSMRIVDLITDIEIKYGILLDIDILYFYPNIAALSVYLRDNINSKCS